MHPYFNYNGEMVVDALTSDHTPEKEDEVKRIMLAGGVVMTSDTMLKILYSQVWGAEESGSRTGR